jgi:8-oxo-dGTP pyrophosphatase MutT (NUDIX family)
MKKKIRKLLQYAALPCRMGENGQAQILLLTSRETRRWVIPKGWPIKGLKPREVAEREAFEESGLVGKILGKRPVGAYHYEKEIHATRLLCEVRVFLFWVDRQLEDWPEKAERETRWFDPAEAAALVDEGGLAELMRVVTGAEVIAPSPAETV